MSNAILIIGPSGSGKSSSIRNLDPAQTAIINVLDKDLPFRNSRKMYNKEEKNYQFSDDSKAIITSLRFISKEKEHIKNVIIDDCFYIMANENMNRCYEPGWDKYKDIAYKFYSLLNESKNLRADLNIYFMCLTGTDDDGTIKSRKIGKMINDSYDVEGVFTVILHAIYYEDSYQFLTNRMGNYLARSPLGMFDEKLIDNDLVLVNSKMEEYFCEEE